MRLRLLIFTGFVFFSFIVLNAEVEYKISGGVYCHGKGIHNVPIIVEIMRNNSSGSTKFLHTDKNGNFSIYLSNGLYEMSLGRTNGYVEPFRQGIKKINVKGKNIRNINFQIKKECKVSGKVISLDGTPITGKVSALSFFSNPAKIQPDGSYLIRGISEGSRAILFYLDGFPEQDQISLNLEEGEHRTKVNLVIPKVKISIQGICKIRNSNKPGSHAYIKVLYNVDADKPKMDNFRADKHGNFKIFNLPKGEIYILYKKKVKENRFHYKKIYYDGINPVSVELFFEL